MSHAAPKGRTPTESTGLREPQQARSRASLERLLHAALELVVEKGHDAASVPEIAERAGVSVGAFYGRFPSKEALFEYLDEQILEEAARCWTAYLAPDNWRGASVAELLDEFIRTSVDTFASSRPLTRALALKWRAHAPSPRIRAAGKAHYDAIFSALETLLRERSDEIEHPDVALASRFVLEVIEATLTDRLTFREAHLSPLQLSKPKLVRELRRMCLTYLGAEDAVPRGRRRSRPVLEGDLILGQRLPRD